MRNKSAVKRARDITEISDHALGCYWRGRHAFPLPVFVDSYDEEGRPAWRADCRCECGVRRVDYCDTFGNALPDEQWYAYPDDYLIAGGKPSKDVIILEIKRRQSAAAERQARKEWLQVAS